MQRTPRPPYPTAAVDWLLGERPARVLDLGSGKGGFAQMLAAAGHEVFAVDRSARVCAELRERLPDARITAARVEALPFLSCHFDVVTASQTLHHFAPGLALTEIARVLKPGGRIAVAYNSRDDTVPWVKRLLAMTRAADPEAMSGDYGQHSVATLADSPYFTGLERRNFRNWIPVTRDGLLTMIERRPGTARLDQSTRQALLAEVGQLYDTVARPPEPLLLPFQAACWRAVVDHSQLAISDDPDAVEIKF
ncbi:class I SAM-dependent methyltransferase [Microlunatus ginsengisoli]|uniref:Class I SAM-dependent methyltransferase n=1 Tax=Microlunatus ginsengisoli TaxID=363863 RepID=A0ABP7APS2_9ACTN